jgi:hypothetical protein
MGRLRLAVMPLLAAMLLVACSPVTRNPADVLASSAKAAEEAGTVRYSMRLVEDGEEVSLEGVIDFEQRRWSVSTETNGMGFEAIYTDDGIYLRVPPGLAGETDWVFWDIRDLGADTPLGGALPNPSDASAY